MGTPSIALTSLSIKDFRVIESLDLDFRGPDGRPNQLVVLAGPNGSGKTSVLEAAILAVGGSKYLTDPIGRKAVRRGAVDFEIQATVWSAGLEDEVVIGASLSRPSQMIESLPIWYFSSWRAPSLVGALDATVGKSGRRPAKTDQNRLRNVKQLLVNAATIERFRPLSSQANRYSDVIRVINNAWRGFYPEQRQTFSVEIVESPDSDGGSFDVYLRTSEGALIEVDLLSAGQLELFLFLSALAFNEKRHGIVFIDEPELHLDPQWHRLILRTLMKLQPEAQFIVATHSPEIFNEAKSYERHFLVPADDPRARIWQSAEHQGV